MSDYLFERKKNDVNSTEITNQEVNENYFQISIDTNQKLTDNQFQQDEITHNFILFIDPEFVTQTR